MDYPKELPVSLEKDRIIDSLQKNQIVIISGATGSGKTTQIPKMCMEAFPKMKKKIVCTQPRRIAAITVAERIAQEMKEPFPGGMVGYKVRFDDKTARNSRIKLVTDGILLAETQKDPFLNEYGIIIVDEAHERSLNIDFILGILIKLTQRRRDLKVIITSATIDTEKFSKAFRKAPIIEVSGRLFPVSLRYSPSEDPEETVVDQAVKVCGEVVKTTRNGGDILIFMATEQDIRETCRLLEGILLPYNTEVLPLFARLSSAEQHRVFDSSPRRRVIVATNVAETSLTIPGIQYVIDSGTARIHEYSPASRTTGLPIRPISKSSANQRMGRCGRIRNGICIRLYEEEDFEERPLFTPAEVLRTNLADVILRMISIKIRDINNFPFIDPPKKSAITDGFKMLEEIGALHSRHDGHHITAEGKIMSSLPLDPRLSKIVLSAAKEDCLPEILVIISALSIQSPLERPSEEAEKADKVHNTFFHKDSDFLSFINIWNLLNKKKTELSNSQFKKFCRNSFISFRRHREWMDVHRQIIRDLKEHEISPLQKTVRSVEKIEPDSPLYQSIHRSLLSGFLSNIAVKEEKHLYLAPRGKKMMIHPGSSIFGSGAEWIVCAEMVHTSRLFGRTAAKISVEMIMEAGKNQIKTTRYDPFWDEHGEKAVVRKKASLYGLSLGQLPNEPLGQSDPDGAMELYIRKALLEKEIPPRSKLRAMPFFQKNNQLIEKIASMEDRLRQRGIIESEEVLFSFYKEKLTGIWSTGGLQKFIRRNHPDLLMTEELLLKSRPAENLLQQFPEYMISDEDSVKLTYSFDPGEKKDGVTLNLKQDQIHQLELEKMEWLVPGLLKEKIEALLRGLPRDKRRKLSPISQAADFIYKDIQWGKGSFPRELSKILLQHYQLRVDPSEWRAINLPDHLVFRVEVRDKKGRLVSSGRGTEPLTKSVQAGSGRETFLKNKWEKADLKGWEWDLLPESVSDSNAVPLYPGLVVEEDRVALRLWKTPQAAAKNALCAQAALLSKACSIQIKALNGDFALDDKHQGTMIHFGGGQALRQNTWRAIIMALLPLQIRTREEWDQAKQLIQNEMAGEAPWWFDQVNKILQEYRKAIDIFIVKEAKAFTAGEKQFIQGLRNELMILIPKNFPEIYPQERLIALPRYIKASTIRAEKGIMNLPKDREIATQLIPFNNHLSRIKESCGELTSLEKINLIEDFCWKIEDFKVSLFAGEIKLPGKVSAIRLEKMVQELNNML